MRFEALLQFTIALQKYKEVRHSSTSLRSFAALGVVKSLDVDGVEIPHAVDRRIDKVTRLETMLSSVDDDYAAKEFLEKARDAFAIQVAETIVDAQWERAWPKSETSPDVNGAAAEAVS